MIRVEAKKRESEQELQMLLDIVANGAEWKMAEMVC